MNSGEGKSAGSNEDGGLGAELLAAAQEGDRWDEILPILEADPTLIHVTDPVGDTTLHALARAGNLEVAEKVVAWMKKHGLTEVLLEQNLQGDTPLHVAIANRHEPVALSLYEAESGAGFVKNEAGVFPFELARAAGFVSWSDFDEVPRPCIKLSTADVELFVVRSLHLGLSSDSSSEDDDEDEKFDGKLYFHFDGAVRGGREDLVLAALRDHPHLISLRSRWGETFLHVAAAVGEVGVLRLLIGHMTPDEAVSFILDQDNNNGETALHAALEKNHKEAARYLFQLAPRAAYQVNKETALRSRRIKAGVSPLYLAVEKGQHDVVKCMLRAMPLTTIPPSTRETLFAPKNPSILNAAIRARNLGILEALMEELPELIDLLDKKGWRVLSYAAYKGYLDGVRYLLKKFSDCIQKYDADGSLPIHKAVGGGDVSIVKEFLQYCPDMLNAVSRNGQSILHFAVKYRKTDVLRYLATEVTEVNQIFYLKDNKGKTAEDLAKELKHVSL